MRKAATAEGGSGASIRAASSPPFSAEVMKIGRLTCALRCSAKGAGHLHSKPVMGGHDVIDEALMRDFCTFCAAPVLLGRHLFLSKAKK